MDHTCRHSIGFSTLFSRQKQQINDNNIVLLAVLLLVIPSITAHVTMILPSPRTEFSLSVLYYASGWNSVNGTAIFIGDFPNFSRENIADKILFIQRELRPSSKDRIRTEDITAFLTSEKITPKAVVTHCLSICMFLLLLRATIIVNF